ncbi:LysR family transcriptional regulator [Verticiella sediminum]|uniref:LysR family transcriptional regulator n=1 Tax=Verticiella sediminum TaxID=1247510 RepID=A0A556ABW5_9BURK|nr:LysR family transcriptional regulator [Verticiella sediminum]TSH90385.1 LysR family transcriptional regulator [Verticiella sediminum]
MKSPNLSIRQLRAFLTLAEDANFRRAAERSHLSHSAFSSLIRTVEEQLGAKLFDRNTRHVSLTPQGQLLEASARRLIGDFDRFLDDFQAHENVQKGRVNVAALPSIAAAWMPRVLEAFQMRHPHVKVELLDLTSGACLEAVRSGQSDFGISSIDPNSQDIEAEFLCDDPFFVVCRQDHALAKKRRISLEDLASIPFIQLAHSNTIRQQIEALYHPASLRPVMEVTQLATVSGLIEAGLGITLMPNLARAQFDRPPLVMRPLHRNTLARRIYLIRRSETTFSHAAQALYDLLHQRL